MLKRFSGVVPLVALLLAAPAAGDWLVTREGVRLETRGDWRVKGKVVLFTLPNGTLSSLRLAEVDLEASRELTERAARPEPEPEETPKPPVTPVMVITDADVAHVERPKPAPAGAGGEDAVEDGAVPGEPLTVTDWTDTLDPQSLNLEIFGSLANGSTEVASAVELTVRVYGADGGQLAANQAVLSTRTLPPGASTNFRVVFPGVDRFADVTFEVAHSSFRLQRPAAPSAEGDDGEVTEAAPEAGDGSESDSSGDSQPER